MKVLVDTCVWTLALRRRRSGLTVDERATLLEVTELIRDDRAVLIGPVRQELLSGLRLAADFDRLRERLNDFEDMEIETADYEEAARCHNRCRAGGVAGSSIDYLICAVALRHGFSLFTVDADFGRYAQHLPLALHQLGGTE